MLSSFIRFCNFYQLFLVVICFVINSVTVDSINFVSVFSEIDLKNWKENIKIVLDYMDFNVILRSKKLIYLSVSNTSKRDYSTCMSLMIIKCDISEVIL